MGASVIFCSCYFACECDIDSENNDSFSDKAKSDDDKEHWWECPYVTAWLVQFLSHNNMHLCLQSYIRGP